MAGHEAADEIRQLARDYEYDRYLAALLGPREVREALIVLSAFAGELQRIQAVTREPMMAAIRLQWWRDVLLARTAATDPDARTGKPLADALVAVIHRHGLASGLALGMIDAAECDIDPSPIETDEEMRQILIKREGALFELAGCVLGAAGGRETWHLAALAYGGVRLAAEYRRRCDGGAQTFLSAQLGMRYAGSDDSVLIEHAFLEPARSALAELREQPQTIDKATRTALLPIAAAGRWLKGERDGLAIVRQRPFETDRFRRARDLLGSFWRGRI